MAMPTNGTDNRGTAEVVAAVLLVLVLVLVLIFKRSAALPMSMDLLRWMLVVLWRGRALVLVRVVRVVVVLPPATVTFLVSLTYWFR